MGATCTYHKIWQWIEFDWSELFNFYWEDFNPNVPSIPSSWTSAGVSNETSTFDLSASNWQPWHEVWCMVALFEASADWEGVVHTENYFQAYRNWSWRTTWEYDMDLNMDLGQPWMYYVYFGIDYDEIWSYSTDYRIRTDRTAENGWGSWTEYTYFTVSWLSIDDEPHNAWYMWVEWRYLCYTDASYTGTSWFKHKIAYDGSRSEYVWTDNAWYIRLDSGDNQRIYYVDSSWMKRRTYPSSQWYGGNANVGSSNRWYMWVSDWFSQEDWYAHLCFIAPNWNKRRILNWPPSWHT